MHVARIYCTFLSDSFKFVSCVDSGLSVSGWPAGGETVSWRQC